MDEADQLGDRIAIMAHGQVQCVGSPLFLKAQFGVGYSLTIYKDGGCDEGAVQSAVTRFVPEAGLVNNVAGEIAYKLPTAASPAFADLFDTFDAHMGDWRIQSYGISITTMEEIFLRVGKDADAAARIHGRSRDDIQRLDNRVLTPRRVDVAEKKGWVDPASPVAVEMYHSKRPADEEKEALGGTDGPMVMSSPSAVKGMDFAALSSPAGQPLPGAGGAQSGEVFDAFGVIEYDHTHKVARHIRALFLKRMANARRNKKNWVWTILIPFLIMIVFLATTKALSDINTPDKVVDLSQYNKPNIVDFVSATPAVLSAVSGGTEQVQLVDETAAVGTNLTAFALLLYASSSSMQLSRFGAFLYDAAISGGALQEQTTVLFNTTADYALPAFLNLYNTALLRNITGNPSANIQLSFWGFPETVRTEQPSRCAAHGRPFHLLSPPSSVLCALRSVLPSPSRRRTWRPSSRQRRRSSHARCSPLRVRATSVRRPSDHRCPLCVAVALAGL